MIKKYLNCTIMLFSAWAVYGTCQNDNFLPVVISSIIILSFFMRVRSAEKQFTLFAHIPLSTTIIVSLIAGWVWGGVIPAPETASSPLPALTSAVQSGTIFASLLIYLRPFTNRNLYYLTFLAWLNVAVSINVPFSENMILIFCFFCIVSTAIIILHTTNKPTQKKYIFRYYRDFIFFSTLIVLMTTGLFYGISKSIVYIDEVFMDLVDDFIMPRNYTHFLKISSRLSLGPPGRSALDRRPVFEITLPEGEGAYLKTQIFDSYIDGSWVEPKQKKELPISKRIDKDALQGKLTMFTSFENIIPSPTGIEAAYGSTIYTKDEDDILYTDDEQRMRMLQFSLTQNLQTVKMTAEQFSLYKDLPPQIASELKQIANHIVGNETDIIKKAYLIQDYFHENFQYTLNVKFKADDTGIIKMLREQRPAYCSYFASALALLLRAEGLPARVAAGFLVTENIDAENNKFLGRVNNAHAWTEVLLPTIDETTGKKIYTWETLDATPISELTAALSNNRVTLKELIENIWLKILRTSAFLESMDRDQLKLDFLKLLIFIILLINRNKIFTRIIKIIHRINQKNITNVRESHKLHSIYNRYEYYLKRTFNVTRNPTDTDQEFFDRIKCHHEIPTETIAKVESFLHHYHAARFGNKDSVKLKEMVDSMGKH